MSTHTTLLGSLILTVGLAASPAAAQTTAITGATVYPVSGPRLTNATILVRDGRIAAIGADVAVPDGARRIDARGKWVTPGLIHSGSDIGLNAMGYRDGSLSGEMTASFNVLEAVNPFAVEIPVARLEGVTRALAMPSGGLIPGQAVLLALTGDRIEAMVTRSPAALVVNFEATSAAGGSRAGVMARLRQLLLDAQEYDRRRADFRRDQIQPLAAPAADLEALLPVLAGQLPVFANADRESDIQSAMRLAGEFKLKLIIRGGAEAWKLAPELAQAGVTVAVDPLTNIPSFNGLGARYDNAALLRAAGVAVLFYETESGGPRNLRWVAGHAVRNGVSWDDALRAITLAPAVAFGVADRLGSLQPGRLADLVIWSGDPFEYRTGAELIMIAGQEQPLTSRQTELFQRYRTLPPIY